MNTVTDITESLEHIPLDHIRVSPLHVQSLRRARFDPAALLELSTSIKNLGVAQPILVRPVPVMGHLTSIRFEIIAGERRWIAADRAGLSHIPAIVRDLSDDAALEIQLVENLQREGLHPLEEGAGYKELMDIKRIDALAVGQLIGKGRSYVYARIKLLDLCDTAREALQSGKLDASKALLVARIQGEKQQRKALQLILDRGAECSYLTAQRLLRTQALVSLAAVPFRLDDGTLTLRDGTPLPACDTCPHRSGNDAELFDGNATNENLCADKICRDQKTTARYRFLREAAEAAGRTILRGAEALAVIPQPYMGRDERGDYVDLDRQCSCVAFPEPDPEQLQAESDADFAQREADFYERMRAWNPPTYRTLLGITPPGTVLAEDKTGKLYELAPVKPVITALKAQGIKATTLHNNSSACYGGDDGSSADQAAERLAEREREEEAHKVEAEFRLRVFTKICEKWKGPLKREEHERIAHRLLENLDSDGAINIIAPEDWTPEAASDSDLIRFIACETLADIADNHWTDATALTETAERFKIDCQAIRAQTVKDLKPTAAPPAADADKPCAAKKKATNK